MMGSVQERNEVIAEIFSEYDTEQRGELNTKQLQMIHSDMRIGSISIPQIKESIKYVCVGDGCEKSELYELLQEMDRRHFLIQDFRWEFSMLDCNQTDTISEEQAKWFLQMVHGEYFSQLRWEKFLRSRAVPGSGVSFAEIEVMLCNIPSKEDYLADLVEEKKEQEDWVRSQKELQRKIEDEKQKRKHKREEERKQQDDEESKKQRLEDKRRKEEEEEKKQKQREIEEAERRRKQLEEEEERGRKEADERDGTSKEKEERDRKDKPAAVSDYWGDEEELLETQRLREQQERQRQEEEDRRRRELEEAGDLEKQLEEATRREREANEEADEEDKRQKAAKDEAVRKDAKDKGDRARLRARDYRNKRIRLQLKVSIKKRDRERLPKAMDDFKKAKLPDDDQDLPKAERILREFEARDGLKKAILSRQIQPLEKAIEYIKYHGFEMQLSHELIEANKILLQLRRLERIRAEILELKQSTVAEIRSYQKPPPVVHVVMTGTFLILGHKEKETKDWKTVQALVGKTGKDGLKRRCLGCEPNMINPPAAARAKVLLGQFDLDEVRDVSAGAATFYLWSWTMIEELESVQAAKKIEEEEKKKEKEAKEKAKQEEKAAKQKAKEEEEKRQQEKQKEGLEEGNENQEQGASNGETEGALV